MLPSSALPDKYEDPTGSEYDFPPDKKEEMKKTKEVVASLKDETGICSKHLGKWLDDLSDNPTFRGERVTMTITVEKGDQ